MRSSSFYGGESVELLGFSAKTLAQGRRSTVKQQICISSILLGVIIDAKVSSDVPAHRTEFDQSQISRSKLGTYQSRCNVSTTGGTSRLVSRTRQIKLSQVKERFFNAYVGAVVLREV